MNIRLYVDNLAATATYKDLMDLFSAHGNVVEVNLPVDRANGRPRGFGFITMVTPEGAPSGHSGSPWKRDRNAHSQSKRSVTARRTALCRRTQQREGPRSFLSFLHAPQGKKASAKFDEGGFPLATCLGRIWDTEVPTRCRSAQAGVGGALAQRQLKNIRHESQSEEAPDIRRSHRVRLHRLQSAQGQSHCTVRRQCTRGCISRRTALRDFLNRSRQ